MVTGIRRVHFLSLLAACCIVLGSGNIYAADAADPSFGTNGKVLEVLSEANGGAGHKAVKVYDDDRIIVAGVAKNDDDETLLALYRYLPDGSRDMSFGTGGASYTDHICQDSYTCGTKFITGGEEAEDIMFQSDGKIIIARTEQVGEDGFIPDPYIGVAGFNRDGTLDRYFGFEGYSMYLKGRVAAGAVQNDDKILVTGTAILDDAPHRALMLSRFEADGSIDYYTFGVDGKLLINVSPDSSYDKDSGSDVTVKSDGEILVVGTTHTKGCGDDVNGIFTRGLLLWINSSGTSIEYIKFTAASVFDVEPWDLSETHPCENSVFKSVAVQPDGKIVVLGTGYNSPYSLFLARFNQNGSLDTTFGYQGVRAVYNTYDYTEFDHLNTKFTYVNGRQYYASNMILQKDGGIVVGGTVRYHDWSCKREFMAMHFTKDGNFDTRYGVNGVAGASVDYPEGDMCTGLGTSGVEVYDLAEQSKGKIILAGHADGSHYPKQAVTLRMIKQSSAALVPIISYLLF